MDDLNKQIEDQIKNDKLSNIKDPFNEDCIDNIWIQMDRNFFNTNIKEWNACIKFKNGNTSGEQKTNKFATFPEVVSAVKDIITEIRNKNEK
jgi:hypothetical protein